MLSKLTIESSKGVLHNFLSLSYGVFPSLKSLVYKIIENLFLYNKNLCGLGPHDIISSTQNYLGSQINQFINGSPHSVGKSNKKKIGGERMNEIIKVPLEKLYVSQLNPRDDSDFKDLILLKNSIIANIKKGLNPLITPLLTRKDKDRDMYEILNGKRRFEATKLIGVSRSRIDGINHTEKEFKLESLRCEVIDVDDETAMMIINATDETFKHKSWYEKAKLYKSLRGKQLKTIGKTPRYERTTNEIRELIGKTVSETTIKQYLKSYEVIEHDEKAKGLPEKACRLISSRSKGDWSILIEKSLSSKHPSAKVEKLIKKINKIREMIEHVSEKETRETVRKQIELIIYEDEMTVDLAEVIIQKAMGIYMNTIEVHLPKPNNNMFYNYYHSAEGYTKEQAEEYAKKHDGYIIGEETFSFWRLYVEPKEDMNLIPYTIDNLEINPPSKISYSNERCMKCGRLIESRMMEKAKKQNYTNVFCANCVLKANKNIIYRR